MEEPQKLCRLPGTIEEEEERDHEVETHLSIPDHQPRVDSPLLGQKSNSGLATLPRSITLVRVSTQSSSIGGGFARQDSTRSRYRAGPTRKLRRRAVFKNGECNVLQSRISRRSLRFLQDIFTTLVDTQWRCTLLCFSLSFILSWLGFAVIWWLIAFTHGDLEEDHLPPYQVQNNWTPCIYNIFSFTSCFLFSIETQHTIGYGSRSTTEECAEAIFVMCLQSISGVMIQALMVGVVFAKMSRPKQRTQTLLFSRNAVVCQRDGDLCLMFRVGDMRKSHIIGATVRAQVIRTRMTKEGEVLPHSQQELAIGTDGSNGNLFFIWPTTIVHKINGESPFYSMSAEEMLTDRFEIVVILEGTIESTGQTTQARSSYLPPEILWGHRFEPMVSYSKERQGYEVDYSFFNNTTQVDTPLCSSKELTEFYRIQEEVRQPNGMMNEEDLLMDCCSEMQTCPCNGHRQTIGLNSSSQHHHPHHYPQNHNHFSNRFNHQLAHTVSVRSDNSFDDSTLYKYANYNNTLQSYLNANNNRNKIVELDPYSIQMISDSELQQISEAINREIVSEDEDSPLKKNPIKREIYNDDDRLSKPTNTRRNMNKHYHLDDERRSLNGSKRNLNLRNCEDEKRSLNGSRRNLNGSKKYLLLALDRSDSNRNLQTQNQDSSMNNRRHTGSKERLSTMRNKKQDQSVSKKIKPKLKNQSSCESVLTTPSTDCQLRSPFSDGSPESGFYDSNRSPSSPDIENDKLHQLSNHSNKNWKSCEHSQTLDENQSPIRSDSSSSSSSDGEPPIKRTIEASKTKQGVSHTSV